MLYASESNHCRKLQSCFLLCVCCCLDSGKHWRRLSVNLKLTEDVLQTTISLFLPVDSLDFCNIKSYSLVAPWLSACWSDINIHFKKCYCIWVFLWSIKWPDSTLGHKQWYKEGCGSMKPWKGGRTCLLLSDAACIWNSSSSIGQILAKQVPVFFERSWRLVILWLEKGKSCTYLQEKHGKDNPRSCRSVNLTLVLGKILGSCFWAHEREKGDWEQSAWISNVPWFTKGN